MKRIGYDRGRESRAGYGMVEWVRVPGWFCGWCCMAMAMVLVWDIYPEVHPTGHPANAGISPDTSKH